MAKDRTDSSTRPQPLLESITLRSGPAGLMEPLVLKPASVNVFVGPNHSGKSLLLREIQLGFQDPEQSPHRKVLREVTFTPFEETRRATLAAEITAAAKPSPTRAESNVVLKKAHWSQEFSRQHFENMLQELPQIRDPGQHRYLRKFFLTDALLMLGGAERLNMLQPTKRDLPQAQSHYVHILSRLFYSDVKRETVQAIVDDAFRCYLVIDPLGENFEAKISTARPAKGIERSLTDEAVTYFTAAVPMNMMSDGVRAFCGSICAVVASDAQVILIDEPEAFLHPALCVKLAKELCKRARQNGQQLFIATHSAPFLMGCIQAGIDLNIIRLTYRDNIATSRVLPQQNVVPLMRQPLLRSIGALTGIFYESVVVTEADSDRAFYDEVNHRCLNVNDSRGIPDALFLNAQNWQTTARIIGPLRALGIAAAAIIDIDFLLESKSEGFQNLIEAAGVPPSSRTALGQLRGELHKILKPQSEELKRRGIECVSGAEKRDLQNFIDQLAKVGVFVVPTGELECWLPNLPRVQWAGKNEWLLRTFEAMGEDATKPTYTQPARGDVWDFIANVRRWLHDPARLGMPDQ
jgi:putative AbiEii toxin of type IV toxin-antitoxin system